MMKRRMRDCVLPCFLLAAACAAVLAPHGVRAQNGQERGEKIFKATCSPCHTIGEGRKVGPDLRGVAKRRPAEWLRAFISDPGNLFSQNDPTALQLLKEYAIKMPNTGLSPDDVNAVIGYLESQSGGAPGSSTAAPSPKSSPAAPAPSGDAARGEQYFTGRVAFQNGGPACMACHSVPGIGFPGGGNLGPDLTTVYRTLGAGVSSVLMNVPFPTMKPIFDRHPVTAAEAGDVAAFLQTVPSARPQNFTGRIIIVSVLCFAVVMLIMLLAWRNRIKSVRKELVERANREDGRL